ncbi:hypothetical protein FVEN_g13188 [Fusarium venenatum]|nr:hypothetical protein FVEN_g13188 [Fusarium venenatum]
MKRFALTAATIIPMLVIVDASCGLVTCDELTICGGGKTSAQLVLDATWTATVRCTSYGGWLVEATLM